MQDETVNQTVKYLGRKWTSRSSSNLQGENYTAGYRDRSVPGDHGKGPPPG